jgi:DNA polymerase-3 subunit gamma/tau
VTHVSQALYRRYRPETFADVIGQEHVTEPLQQALRTGRVNHAYLFSGPRGCGKTTSARILARCLNCEQGPTDVPCGTCDSCVALARGGAGTVDVIEIDAASHGGVDDARELRERASYGPAQSRYKIYIIDEAHMVTPQGFNALLKIVEEPPEHVKFVFATTEPEKVIGTIRSRTHHYPFRLVPPARLQDYLASLCESEGVPVEPGVLSFVVRAGGGSVRDSLSVLDQLIAGSGAQGLTYEGAAALLGFTDAELLDATVTALGHGDAAAAFGEVDKVIETGLDPRRFVEDLLERLRDLIICAAVPDGAAAVLRGVPSDQLERMHVQASAFGPGGLSRAADIVNAGLTEMTGATAPRLQLELIIARLLLPGAAGPAGYAARLDRIERRLEMGVRESSAAPSVPTSVAPPVGTSAVPAGTSSAPVAGAAQRDTGGASEPPMSAPPMNAPTRTESPRTEPAGSAPSGDAPSTERVGPAPASPESASSSSPPVGPPVPSESLSPEPPSQEPRSQASRSQAPETPAVPAGAPASTAGPSAPSPSSSPPSSPPPSPRPTAGGLDQAAIMRAWPDILDWLSRHKRVTWTLVSASTQPLSFDGSRLILSIETAGLAETFRRGAHSAFVQEALMEVLGIDARVEGVVSGDARDAGRSSGAAQAGAPITTPAALSAPTLSAPPFSPAPSAPQQPRPGATAAGSGRPAEPSDAEHPPPSGEPSAASTASADAGAAGQPGRTADPAAQTTPPRPAAPGREASATSPEASPPTSAPAPSAARGPAAGSTDWSSSPPPAAAAPAWATDGEDPLERTPAPPRAAVVPRRPEQPAPVAVREAEVVDDPDSISDDDEDIETSGEVGQAVVERLLGATVISEDED